MRKRCPFRPGLADRLEARIALTGTAHITPVEVRPLTFRQEQAGLQTQVTTQVNQAFDSFTEDYLRAQATYVATLSMTPASTTSAPYAAFNDYIGQRVRLLAEQLVTAFGQVPGGLNYVPAGPFGSGSYVVQLFLRRQIDGPATGGADPLLVALRDNIPTASDAQTIALYTLNATTAVNTAREATLNSIQFLIHHIFSNGHKPH